MVCELQSPFASEVGSTIYWAIPHPDLAFAIWEIVHADDVAQAFCQAMANRRQAIGESFHVVSPAALTLRGYAEEIAIRLGREANLTFQPWEEWKKTVSEEEASATWDHIAHSPNCSIAKAERLIDYYPRYSSLEAVADAIAGWQLEGEV